MKNLFLLSLISLFFVGCTNLSKNTIKEGTLLVKNGTMAEQVWTRENLNFKRYSWYHELTLQFDVMISEVSPQSSFNFWFAKDELLVAQKCGDFKIVMAYSYDTKIVPYSHLNKQLELSGYKKIEIPEFKKQLLQHPDSEMNSLRLYQVYGICREERNHSVLKLSLPGFIEKQLN